MAEITREEVRELANDIIDCGGDSEQEVWLLARALITEMQERDAWSASYERAIERIKELNDYIVGKNVDKFHDSLVPGSRVARVYELVALIGQCLAFLLRLNILGRGADLEKEQKRLISACQDVVIQERGK